MLKTNITVKPEPEAQQIEDWLEEILDNVEGQYSSHDGKIRGIVRDIFTAGIQNERNWQSQNKVRKIQRELVALGVSEKELEEFLKNSK